MSQDRGAFTAVCTMRGSWLGVSDAGLGGAGLTEAAPVGTNPLIAGMMTAELA